MTAPESFVMPEDVTIVPVTDLPADVRKSFDCTDEDFVISRPRARVPSTVIDGGAARLLQRFREPSTIVQAVILFARETSAAPDRVLEAAYPLVRRLVQNRTLISCDHAEAQDPMRPLFEPGARVAGVAIVRPLVLLEDTELYLARDDAGAPAVVKCVRLPRSEGGGGPVHLLENEAAVLARIGGDIAPRLCARGDVDGRPLLVLEYIAGVDALQAAAELRAGGGGESGRPALHALITAIARCYADLHAAGVVHGDVHPQNILVDAAARPRLIDFGFADAADPDAPRRVGRGGVPFYLEPEHAAQLAGGGPPPRATPAGEQYALGALLYELVTGVHYLDFNIERSRMLEQIVANPMRPLSLAGVDPWPGLEAALARALAKDPAARFPTVAALADALAQAAPAPQPPPAELSGRLRAAGRGIIEDLRCDGAVFERGLETAPTASLFCGAAGIGYGLYRLAVLTEDPRRIADAQAWIMRAAGQLGRETAFQNPANELTPATVGTASPYHCASGVHAVQALIAGAMGDPAGQDLSIQAFLESSATGAQGLDATTGIAAILHGTTLLLDAAERVEHRDTTALRHRGAALLDTLWTTLATKPPIAESDIRYLGIAHGWAGLLHATLAWCRAAGAAPPDQLGARLDDLARFAEPVGRGVMWPWVLGRAGEYMSGWCNGSAGYVFLWTLAGDVLGKPGYRDLAVQAGWHTAEAADPASTLCCGLIGRAYALVHLYKHTGERRWLDYAQRVATRAAMQNDAPSEYPISLYKGKLPLALLAVELEDPDAAAFPFFESEAVSEALHS